MVHLYTGEGKGKTSAAIGLCIRAVGWNRRICFAQFMKGNDTGEVSVLESLPAVTVLRSRKNFGFYHSMSGGDKAELTDIHNEILDRLLEIAESGKCDMIILDEVTYPVKWNLLDMEKLQRLLEMGKGEAAGKLELVLTGRGAEDVLSDAADYITEMACVRHPFEKGVKARKGVEF